MPSLDTPGGGEAAGYISTGLRDPGIDLLRGFSILLVVLHHIGLRIPLKHTDLGTVLPRWLTDTLNYDGYEAVFVFFVISGFLITGNSLRRWGSLERIDLKGFYVRRFARIVPCLLSLVVVLSVMHLMSIENYRIHRDGQSLTGAIASALGFYLNWYEGRTGYLPGNWDVLWSLSIEEVFYIGFPLICLLTRRRAVLVPCLVVLALSLPFTRSALASNEIWQEKAYLPGMAAIAMGVLAALLVASPTRPRRWFNRSLLVAGFLGLASVFCADDILWSTWRDGYVLILTASAACLVSSFHWRATEAERRPLPGFGWLRALGTLSYEVYLTHMFVVFVAVRLYQAYGADHPGWGWIWYLPTVAACWLLGLALARWISTPADRYLRHRLLARPSTAAMVDAGG